MTDEELIERLERIKTNNQLPSDSDNAKYLEAAAQRLRDMQWVKCRERLPEEGQRVLMGDIETKHVEMGIMFSQDNCIWRSRENYDRDGTPWEYFHDDFSHWMLPEPPHE